MSLRKNINERGVPLEEYPDTYLSAAQKQVQQHKTTTVAYANAFKELIDMMKEMSWKDITFLDGPDTARGSRVAFPLLPENVRNKMKEIARINPNKARIDFKRGEYTFAKSFDDSSPSTSNTIYMMVERSADGQRSHFPNEGLPTSLRGTNLGYKLYRSLLQKFKYLRSNTGGTTEKNYAWQSLVSPKKDVKGRTTEDDVHAIVGKSAVFAMIKDLPKAEKIKYATAFLNNTGEINKSEITKRNFGIDDELKKIMPEEIIVTIDPARREEAERLRREQEAEERKKRERDAARTMPDRIALYAPYGLNAHDWEVGDYIVLKDYLLQQNYTSLPIRKVVAKEGMQFTALKLSDLVQYETDGTINDPRVTRDKNKWIKSDNKKGQYGYMVDPTAGRKVVKGSPGGRTVTPTVTPTTQATHGADPDQEQTPQQRTLITNFMRQDFSLFVKSDDWNRKAGFASRKRPMIPFLVKKTGTGGNAIYKVMNARTAQVQDNLNRDQFEALGLKKFDMHQLERKSSVRPGDWVFVKNHRSAMGFVCVVYRVTPADNRQPGLYIWTGESRPQYISQPPILWKLSEAANESVATSFLRFGDFV